MLVTLENEEICLQISDHGAEIHSLVKKDTGIEYIWQRDETYWGRCAIPLFPICGRLKNGAYSYEGRRYRMDIHGFVKDSDLRVEDRTEASVRFVLEENAETLRQYPFRFRFELQYSIVGSCVRQTFRVKNPGTGDLLFSLGAHPGFNVPLQKGEAFEDYELRFDDERTPDKILFSGEYLYLGKTEPFPLQNGVLPLRHELFQNDAIFLTNVSPAVTLRSRVSGRSVRMTYPKMRNLGFWHKPRSEAPYLCIEPWSAVPAFDREDDALERKPETERLAPGGEYENEITISVT